AYGFEGAWIGERPKQLRQELKEGHPVIATMGPGTFTSNGHYILIYGIDPYDRVRVIDPNSKSKSLKLYPLQTIFDENAGSHAFLICSLQEDISER
ncbi:MAG: C39 family peptidase, partial [Syntrophomonadaceae bacterium]|nr:C39 family peptidase [Syntrophomonadaceae bacterium]